MSFSGFLKILKKYYGDGVSAVKFVQLLFAVIIGIDEKIAIKNADDKPLKEGEYFEDIVSDALADKLFSGGRNIPKSLIEKIIPKLNREKFIFYLDRHNNDVITKINDELMLEGFLNLEDDECVANMYGKIYDIFVWFIENPGKDYVIINDIFHNLPHSRNAYFTGREEKLKAIRDNFKNKDIVSLTQSVTGLGGVGKSSIVLEYAYEHFYEYETICWINAGNEQEILNAYRHFCLEKKLIQSDAKSDEIINKTQNWFNNKSNKKWIFIYDNADADNFYEWFEKYLPQINNHNGHVLITTRSDSFPQSKSINIDIFTEEEAIQFLEKRMEERIDKFSYEWAKELVFRLDRFPLALEQAAAYILEHPVSILEYIEMFEEFPIDMMNAFHIKLTSYKKTLYKTWKISFDKIESEEAIQLFNICAYFASYNIPLQMLIEGRSKLPPLLHDVLDRMSKPKLYKLLWELKRHSLVMENQSEQGIMLTIHCLVQEVVRLGHGEDTKWLNYALDVIHNVFYFDKDRQIELTNLFIPDPDDKQKAIREIIGRAWEYEYKMVKLLNDFMIIFPHAMEIANNVDKIFDNTRKLKIGNLYFEAGYGMEALDDFDQALNYHEKALEIRKKVLNPEHSDLADSYNHIALAYDKQGDYTKALELYQEALEIRKKVLAPEHQDTSISYFNIASIYLKQGNYIKALEFFLESYRIDVKALGKTHPSTMEKIFLMEMICTNANLSSSFEVKRFKIIKKRKYFK